jgi:hypothetical protein
MSPPSLEDRVSALESAVARLAEALPGESSAPAKDWRSTLGMFAHDPIMKEVIDEGQKLRQSERDQVGE